MSSAKQRSHSIADSAPHLPVAGLRFLRSLKRNNDRDWFNARKETYEKDLLAPWLEVIEAINNVFLDFAPEYAMPPRKALMRIYRDIRFSPDKRPYKTHMAAWWSTTTTERANGGGFYVHAGADDVTVAAGVYQPAREQLLAIRRHLQQHHEEFRGIWGNSHLQKLLTDVDTNPLTRVPKGFSPDDPAADLVKCRQWARSIKLPSEAATAPQFVQEIGTRFRAAAPMVALLNAPLMQARKRTRPLV